VTLMIKRLLPLYILPLLTVLTICCCLPCRSSPPQSDSQVIPGNTELTPAKADFNSDRFSPPPTLTPPGVEPNDLARRPFVYWRAWINQKFPYPRMVWFLMITGLVLHYLFGKLLIAAKEDYDQHWLRCLGIGILVAIISGIVTATAARMGIFAPLATLIQAVTQCLSLLGMTLAADSLGLICMRAARLESRLQKPWLVSTVHLLVGVLLLSLFVLIPGVGTLPRLGNRILALFGAAGLGAICIQLQSRKQQH
jgi:hypothetical protein